MLTQLDIACRPLCYDMDFIRMTCAEIHGDVLPKYSITLCVTSQSTTEILLGWNDLITDILHEA